MGQIQVSDIGKAYKHHASRFSRFAEWFSFSPEKHYTFKWVLQNISFCVSPGEALGIVGINGAGKSTLLKILTGTTVPTTGKIHMTGRVAAMLELGMGFHPDFTGRQNAQMAAQLLGYTAKDIEEVMPAIEEFTEIGEAMDETVRTYSSGMQMRLAFSVATAIRPDILIIDEALSVGDAYFQHKSFERIQQFQKMGTTLLFVSHDAGVVRTICDRVILLDNGKILKEGKPDVVMDYYNAIIAEREYGKVLQIQSNPDITQTISGTKEATVEAIVLLNQDNKPLEYINVGDRVTLKIIIKIHQPIARLVLGYMIKDRLGQPMFGTNTHLLKIPLHDLKPEEILEYYFVFPMNLGAGTYSISTALTSTETHLLNNYEWKDLALLFNVMNINHSIFVGCNWLNPEVKLLR